MKALAPFFHALTFTLAIWIAGCARVDSSPQDLLPFEGGKGIQHNPKSFGGNGEGIDMHPGFLVTVDCKTTPGASADLTLIILGANTYSATLKIAGTSIFSGEVKRASSSSGTTYSANGLSLSIPAHRGVLIDVAATLTFGMPAVSYPMTCRVQKVRK